MEYISSDIISEILLRVPADCITKLKTVCKLWNSIITDSKFIDSHLQHNISNSPEILLFSPELSFSMIDSKSWSISHILLKEFTQTPCFGGSCNGLICLYGFETGIAKVINPATKESLNLVKHSINPEWDHTSSEYCLGFDPWTNKYKVARMCTIYKAPEISSLFEVCNVSDGDISWRQIGGIVGGAYTISSGVYCNGGLYWLAMGYHDSKFWLFCFDLKEEKISIIDETKCDVLFKLDNYKDCYPVQLESRLCLVASMDNIMNVWMMGGTINDWYLRYRIWIPWPYIMTPLFVMGRKILMRDFVRKELKYYNIDTCLYESVLAFVEDDIFCCMHVASLVKLNSLEG